MNNVFEEYVDITVVIEFVEKWFNENKDKVPHNSFAEYFSKIAHDVYNKYGCFLIYADARLAYICLGVSNDQSIIENPFKLSSRYGVLSPKLGTATTGLEEDHIYIYKNAS